MCYMWSRPSTKRGSWNLQFNRPFLDHHIITTCIFSVCLIYCPGVKKMTSKKINNFSPKIIFLWGGGGSWNLQFLVSLPYWYYTHANFGKGWLCSSVADDERRRTLTHSSRSPEWLWLTKICIYIVMLIYIVWF